MAASSSTAQGPSLMVHSPVNIMITVQEALSRLAKSPELQEYILSKRELWAIFGKMNSHLYRAILMKRMLEAKLNPECQFMVFFLFSVIKNRDRVIRQMEAMDPTDQQKPWFNPVKNFITTHITQYVSDVVRSKKFPAVNIPTCNPGLDVLVYCLITHPNDRTTEELFNRPTASQLFLDDVAQDEAKEGYRYYWNSIVTGSKNPDAKDLEVPEFREDYYKNSRADDYRLVDLELKEVEPLNPAVGYSLKEIKDYMISIDPKNEYNPAVAALEKEFTTMPVPVPVTN